jgi:hypothetical protein
MERMELSCRAAWLPYGGAALAGLALLPHPGSPKRSEPGRAARAESTAHPPSSTVD